MQPISGVFRIPVNRQRGAIGVGEGWGVVEGAWPLLRKKSFFVPKTISLGAFRFLHAVNQDISLKALGGGFYGSIAKRRLQNSAKII